MGTSFGLRIGAPLFLVMVAAIALNVFLIHSKFQDSFAAIEESRYGFIVAGVRGAVQSGLDLGLGLQSLANAQAILDDKLSSGDDVLSMSILDEAGRVLYRAGAEDGALPAGVLSVDTVLTDNLGRVVGKVVLRYADNRRLMFRDQMRQALLSPALGALAAGAAIILLAATLLLGGIQRRLNGVAADLATTDARTGDAETAGARAALDEAERGLETLTQALDRPAARP